MDVEVIWAGPQARNSEKQKYFCEGRLTGNSVICPSSFACLQRAAIIAWASVRGESFDADADVSPCDNSANRILQLGQRAGAMSRIDPAAQRGGGGLKTDARPDIEPLRSVYSFVHGMGRDGPIRQ